MVFVDVGQLLGEVRHCREKKNCGQCFMLSQRAGPHTKNGLIQDDKNNIRMETTGEPMDRKIKNKMAG